MSFPTAFVLAAIGLIISAHARLNAVLFGQPVSIPWLGLIFAALLLALVVLALCVIRALVLEFRKEPEPEPRPVHVITTLR